MTVASVDEQRLTRELDALAAISDAPAPAVTRVVFTETDRRARAYVKGLCAERGPACAKTPSATRSPAGQAPSRSSRRSAPARTSTRFRTPAATTAPSACSAASRRSAPCRARVRPRRSIELMLFTSEEPTRFGIGCLGSRLLVGRARRIRRRAAPKGTDGHSLDEARAAAGFHGPLSSVRFARRRLLGVRRAAHRTGAAAGAARTRRSASSRRSPRPPACGRRSRVRAAMPARC